MQIITLESCHSTWIFDTSQLRFCRILRGIAVGQRRVSTEWRPYWNLEIDQNEGTFTVALNEARSRQIRSSLHAAAGGTCGGTRTTELSIEEIGKAVA